MKNNQVKNTLVLFFGQVIIKGSSFIKQLLMAYFLGVSAKLDLLLVAQIVPSIIASMIAGGAGEVIVIQQRKGRKNDDGLVIVFVFCVLVLTFLASALYLGTIPLFAKLFDINNNQMGVFWAISILIVLSKLPSAIVSTLQHLLYAKEKYKYFVFSTIISEISGILTILFLIESKGIIAIAYGLLVTPSINAIFFIIGHKLRISLIARKEVWLNKKADLLLILNRTASLSIQTLLNHLSMFCERTLSFRYLQPGFLSALNYSRNLTQLPKLALLSSILTTTYIEQMNNKTNSEESYQAYSNKAEVILSEISFIFQILSMIFGPLILILLFRRGAFDNEAVETCFIIYQILTVGFLPELMLSFLSRTMYIEAEYKKLLIINIIKFLVEIFVMIFFISLSAYFIPIALVFGKFLISVTIFVLLLKKNPKMFNIRKFVKIYSLSIIISIFILIVNQFFIDFLMRLNLMDLILIYIPMIFISSIAIYLKVKNRYGTEIKSLLLTKRK